MELIRKAKAEKREQLAQLENQQNGQEVNDKNQQQRAMENTFVEKIRQLINTNMETFINKNYLEKYKVAGIDSIYYIPNIQDKELLGMLWEIIENQNTCKWENLTYSKRRLQKWGGDVLPEGLSNKEALPNWLQCLSDFLNELQITHPGKNVNHFLINNYKNEIGIMPHTDGPLYHPYVCTFSLGSAVRFNFLTDNNVDCEDNANVEKTLVVEDGSLLIFTNDTYEKYLHCIKETIIEGLCFKFNASFEINNPNSFANLEYLSSTSGNFEISDLWNTLSENLCKETSFEKFEDKIECILKEKLKGSEMQLKQQVMEEDDLRITEYIVNVEWPRYERISLTSRHAYE